MGSSSEEEDDEPSSPSSGDTDGDSDGDTEDEEEEEEDNSDDEIIEMIQVGDVRTAFAMATGGKNCCTLEQFPSVLETLNIKLNEKRTEEFFVMLDAEASNEIGWNSMFYALRDGQSKFKGQPMDLVVGGLLYEFAASSRGKKMKQMKAKRSMISFMDASGLTKDGKGILPVTDTSAPTLGVPSTNNTMTKPTRKLSSHQPQSSESTINEDDERDSFKTTSPSRQSSAAYGVYAISMYILIAISIFHISISLHFVHGLFSTLFLYVNPSVLYTDITPIYCHIAIFREFLSFRLSF